MDLLRPCISCCQVPDGGSLDALHHVWKDSGFWQSTNIPNPHFSLQQVEKDLHAGNCNTTYGLELMFSYFERKDQKKTAGICYQREPGNNQLFQGSELLMLTPA